jgi:hypothetical protein
LGAVSEVMERMKMQIYTDKKLRNRIEELERRFRVGEEQI